MVERRYSEFLNLHKKIHKLFQSHLDFPPKKMLNKDHKVLNSRRLGLESYFQMLLNNFPSGLPDEVYKFLGVDVCQRSRSRSEEMDGKCFTSNAAQHQPVVAFEKNTFLQETPSELCEEKAIADSITSGTLIGMYEKDAL